VDGLIRVEESVEFVAPAAPVCAELEKNDFVIFFGLFESCSELLSGVGGFIVDDRFGCVCVRGVAEPRERKSNEQEEAER